jgi:hypothetical protein
VFFVFFVFILCLVLNAAIVSSFFILDYPFINKY